MNSLTLTAFGSHSAKTLWSQSSLRVVLLNDITKIFFSIPKSLQRRWKFSAGRRLMTVYYIERDVTTSKTNESQNNTLKNVTFYDMRFHIILEAFKTTKKGTCDVSKLVG